MASFLQVVAKALEANKSPEELSLQESEEKFASLALAFKTDRETLDKRIELHLRARDVAEQNIQKELECLKDGIKVLNQSCGSGPSAPQIFAKIQTHFDVLEKSITRMSSRAEVHGAVQQELRVSQVIETMLDHVENLKRTYQTEHRELQEARKSLNDNNPDGTELAGISKAADRGNFGASGPVKGSLRRISLALMARSPKLLRNPSLPISDSFYSSSPAATPGSSFPPLPLYPQTVLSTSDNYLENNSFTDSAVASRGSSQFPQPNRRYSANQMARNGDTTRWGAEDLRRRRVSKGRRGPSKEDGNMHDVSLEQKMSDSSLDKEEQTSSEYIRELLKRVLIWFFGLLRNLLQRSIRDGVPSMLRAISSLHTRRIISPGLIVLLMFLMSATALLVIIWTRWRTWKAIPTS